MRKPEISFIRFINYINTIEEKEKPGGFKLRQEIMSLFGIDRLQISDPDKAGQAITAWDKILNDDNAENNKRVFMAALSVQKLNENLIQSSKHVGLLSIINWIFSHSIIASLSDLFINSSEFLR